MCLARDPQKYGILMLQGKLINALMHDESKLLANNDIQLLMQALNIHPHQRYNPKDLRYGKVAICVDSDSDGDHIALLIMAAFMHFCPQYIEENRLCWLRSPLYIVKNKGEESYFFTDKDMDAVRGKVKGEIQRNKGLGSLSPQQAHDSMFVEDNQRMDVLVPDKETNSLLVSLMGQDEKFRKEYVFNEIDFSEVRE